MSALSKDWLYVVAWSEKRIARWREELETLNVTHDRANQLRGMIDALREQRKHFEPTPIDPPKDPEDTGYGI